MNTEAIHRLSSALFLSLLALLPFELPIAEAVHGVLRDRVGEIYPLFFVGTLLIVVGSFTLLTGRVSRARLCGRATEDYLLLALAFVLIGVYALVVTLFREAWIGNSIRQLLLGHVAPVVICLVILLLDRPLQRRAWAVFYGGYVAFLVLSLVFLFLSYRAAAVQYPSFFTLGVGQRLFMWRFTFGEPWNQYAVYIGNANKTSNNLLVFLLLSVNLLGEKAVESSPRLRRLLLAFWVLGTLTLVLLFSRAALLLLPFVIWGSGVLPLMRSRTKLAISGTVLLSAGVAFSAYADAIGYLLTSRSIDDTSLGYLGTFGGRLENMRMVKGLVLDRLDVLLGGLGTSGFSMLFFGDQVMGTHNTFLDTLVESGIGGFLLLVGLMLLMLSRTIDPIRLRLRHPLGLLAVLTLIMLMTREHSFAYLYATSLGGFCFTAIFLVIVQNDEKIPTSPADRGETERAPPPARATPA